MSQPDTAWNSDRTETALRTILGAEENLDRFSGYRVLVDVPETDNQNCQTALFTAINLLARLAPMVDRIDIQADESVERQVFVPGVRADDIGETVVALNENIGSPVTAGFDAVSRDAYDAVLHLGDGEFTGAAGEVGVSSRGWLVHTSTTGAVDPFGDEPNPIGAHTAGCIGCAEVFKQLLLADASDENLDTPVDPVDDVTFSTFNYTVDPTDPANPALPDVVDVDDLHVIGVGAGGGALVYALSTLSDLQGTVRLVDSDEVSASNLNRYLWAYADDVGAMKADVSQRLLMEAHPDFGSSIHSHPVPYEEYSDTVDSSELRLAVSTVDTARARKQIQWDLPETVLDAATNQQGDYVVLRVEFGEGQCLACKHVGSGDGVEREMAALAETVGLDADTLVRMNTNNEAFTADQVSVIEEQGTGEVAPPEPGERFSDWFRQQCGHVDLGGADMAVPVPFLPVTAGILLAGEVIKDRHFPDHTVNNRFTHNMLSEPREAMHYPANANPECSICQDEDVREFYRSKWDGETRGEAAIIEYINEAYPANRSAEQQAAVVSYLYATGAVSGSEQRVRTRRILEQVDEATRTHIDNLVNEVGLVEEHEPRGGRSFIFHERRRERVSDDLEAVLDVEVERLLDHLREDEDAREFVVDLLEIETEDLDGDEVLEAIKARFDLDEDEDRMDLFDEVAQEIEASDIEKGDHEYAPIGWRQASNRYTITQRAVNLYRGDA
ncbi:hypothetical protein J2754_002918 [Halarchaeum solikamskense]|uniref:THIF-type NAD/FAD binding fold domain-containing protein n=1 Tax=Halosegnis longus TaxID=2216012 RepID=A0AAJ4UUN4_9EURY|nr:ThiF family adenylyltransferase [Halarchaeum solikamskense]MBP2252572.1 hypothetical protein [Halarchaeum solikamskense]RNJ22664.1 hypothetical protein Nmn1133_13630 [Salella cibi]